MGLFRKSSKPLITLVITTNENMWEYVAINYKVHVCILHASDVKYFEFSMKEFVQNWRKMWFYIKDRKAATGRSGLPKFADVLVA